MTILDLTGNEVGDEGVKHLANALQQNQVTQNVPSFAISPFILYFSQTLTILNLSSNEIGDEEAQHVANALKHNQVRQKTAIHLSLIFDSIFFIDTDHT